MLKSYWLVWGAAIGVAMLFVSVVDAQDKYIVRVESRADHVNLVKHGKFADIWSYEGEKGDVSPYSPTMYHRNFGGPRDGEVTFNIVHLNREATTEDVFKELNRLGLRPTLSYETLAFAAQHPDVQTKIILFGLGSSWVRVTNGKADSGYPALFSQNGQRTLGLRFESYGNWPADSRFLAVPK